MVYKLPYSANVIRRNSILAMAAHIVVSPRFEYIVFDKNWVNDTFAYQDYESTDGVISFSDNNLLVGLFRNPTSDRISEYPDKNILEFFESAEMKERIDIAAQYMLIEFPVKGSLFHKEKKRIVPTITTACWAAEDGIFSLDPIDIFLKHGGNYLEFLNCETSDLIRKLTDDYEMTESELMAANKIFDAKLNQSKPISIHELAVILKCEVPQRIIDFISGFGLEMSD